MLIGSQWSLFTNPAYYLTSGQSNTGLTLLKNLFSDHPAQVIWKVELVVALTASSTQGAMNQTFEGSTSMQFFVNFAPLPGVCDVTPQEGNTTTTFFIICNSWTDPDGSVTKYSFYGKFLNFLTPYRSLTE
jgi:hypothetical protein